MSQFKTLQFPNTPSGQANKVTALERESENGWRVVSETIIPGKFKTEKACCFFLIFAPCAFLAGHEDDVIQVTLERGTPTAVEPVPTIAPQSPESAPVQNFDRAKWVALSEYDADVEAAASEVRPLGQKWEDELASAYMTLKDKAYLSNIVAKIKSRAEEERRNLEVRALQLKEAEQIRANEAAEAKWQTQQLNSARVSRRKEASDEVAWYEPFWNATWKKVVFYLVLLLILLKIIGLLSAESLSDKPDNTNASVPPPPAVATPAEAQVKPSFDCSTVHSEVLLLICGTPSLAAADLRLAAAYEKARRSTADLRDLRNDERAWIKARNNSSADVATIGKMYENQIAALYSAANPSSASEVASAPTVYEGGWSYIIGLDPNGDNWLALRSEPSAVSGDRLAKLPPDTLFKVTGASPPWLRVELTDGTKGWVFSRYVSCCRAEPIGTHNQAESIESDKSR